MPAPRTRAVRVTRWVRFCGEPMVEEAVEPAADRRVVLVPALEMEMAQLGARHQRALMPADRPAAHHRRRHLRVELDAVGARPRADGLDRKIAAGRQALRAGRAVEALAVPLIDGGGPVEAGLRRMLAAVIGEVEPVIADLGPPLRMGVDPAAQRAGQHLRAQADAEIGRLFLQADIDPVDLGCDEIVRIVGRHRPAEDHRAGMVAHRLGSGSP
jgi:hypothetical protein